MMLSDDQRNQLTEMRHDPCEAHCVDCGACDWEHGSRPATTIPVLFDEFGRCPECSYYVPQVGDRVRCTTGPTDQSLLVERLDDENDPPQRFWARSKWGDLCAWRISPFIEWEQVTL